VGGFEEFGASLCDVVGGAAAGAADAGGAGSGVEVGVAGAVADVDAGRGPVDDAFGVDDGGVYLVGEEVCLGVAADGVEPLGEATRDSGGRNTCP